MLTVDLSTGGEHEVGGQIGLFESNQATFARHKDAIVVTNASPSLGELSRCSNYRLYREYSHRRASGCHPIFP
jgi:hypothetical protein